MALSLSISLVPLNNPPAAGAAHPAFSIPVELGSLETSWQGTSGKTLIFIQDAHDSLEAQQNVARLIAQLVEQHGVRTVFEEGYAGPVPTGEFFGFIRDPQEREKVAFFLLDRLRISGAEYAHITRRKDFDLIGVDHIALHFKTIERYRDAVRVQKEAGRDLQELASALEHLANLLLPQEFKTWFKLKDRFERHELGLLDYVERTRALFSSRLPAETFAALVPSEGTTAVAYFEALRNMENVVANLLARERDHHLLATLTAVRMLQRLNRLEITATEYQAAREALHTLRTQDIARFIAREAKKTVVLSKHWERAIQNAIAFYETAAAREDAMLPHLDRFLADPNQRIGVLVFGGFHKDGILRRLQAKGVSYHAVLPRLSAPDPRHQAIYRQLMSSPRAALALAPLNLASRPPSFPFEAALRLGSARVHGQMKALHRRLAEKPSARFVAGRSAQPSLGELLTRNRVRGKLAARVLSMGRSIGPAAEAELVSFLTDLEGAFSVLYNLPRAIVLRGTLARLVDTAQVAQRVSVLKAAMPSLRALVAAHLRMPRRRYGRPAKFYEWRQKVFDQVPRLFFGSDPQQDLELLAHLAEVFAQNRVEQHWGDFSLEFAATRPDLERAVTRLARQAPYINGIVRRLRRFNKLRDAEVRMRLLDTYDLIEAFLTSTMLFDRAEDLLAGLDRLAASERGPRWRRRIQVALERQEPDLFSASVFSVVGGNAFVVGRHKDFYVLLTNTHVPKRRSKVGLRTTSATGRASIVPAHVVLRAKPGEGYTEGDGPHQELWRDVAVLVARVGDFAHPLRALPIAAQSRVSTPGVVADSFHRSFLVRRILPTRRMIFLSGPSLPGGSSGSPYLIQTPGGFAVAAIHAMSGPLGVRLTRELRRELLESLSSEAGPFEVISRDPAHLAAAMHFLTHRFPSRHTAARAIRVRGQKGKLLTMLGLAGFSGPWAKRIVAEYLLEEEQALSVWQARIEGAIPEVRSLLGTIRAVPGIHQPTGVARFDFEHAFTVEVAGRLLPRADLKAGARVLRRLIAQLADEGLDAREILPVVESWLSAEKVPLQPVGERVLAATSEVAALVRALKSSLPRARRTTRALLARKILRVVLFAPDLRPVARRVRVAAPSLAAFLRALGPPSRWDRVLDGAFLRSKDLGRRVELLLALDRALARSGLNRRWARRILEHAAYEEDIEAWPARVLRQAGRLARIVEQLRALRKPPRVIATFLSGVLSHDDLGDIVRMLGRMIRRRQPFSGGRAVAELVRKEPGLFASTVLSASSDRPTGKVWGNAVVVGQVGRYYILLTSSHLVGETPSVQLTMVSGTPWVAIAPVVVRHRDRPTGAGGSREPVSRDIAIVAVARSISASLRPFPIRSRLRAGDLVIFADGRDDTLRPQRIYPARRIAMLSGTYLSKKGSSGSPFLVESGTSYAVAAVQGYLGPIGVRLTSDLGRELAQAFRGQSPYFEIVPESPLDAQRAVRRFLQTAFPAARRHAAARRARALDEFRKALKQLGFADWSGELIRAVRASGEPAMAIAVLSFVRAVRKTVSSIPAMDRQTRSFLAEIIVGELFAAKPLGETVARVHDALPLLARLAESISRFRGRRREEFGDMPSLLARSLFAPDARRRLSLLTRMARALRARRVHADHADLLLELAASGGRRAIRSALRQVAGLARVIARLEGLRKSGRRLRTRVIINRFLKYTFLRVRSRVMVGRLDRLAASKTNARLRERVIEELRRRKPKLFSRSVFALVGGGNAFVVDRTRGYYVLLTSSHLVDERSMRSLKLKRGRLKKFVHAKVVLRRKRPEEETADVAVLLVKEKDVPWELEVLPIHRRVRTSSLTVLADAFHRSLLVGRILPAQKMALLAGETPRPGASGSPYLVRSGRTFSVAAVHAFPGPMGVRLTPELRDDLLAAFRRRSRNFQVLDLSREVRQVVEDFLKRRFPGAPGGRHTTARAQRPAQPDPELDTDVLYGALVRAGIENYAADAVVKDTKSPEAAAALARESVQVASFARLVRAMSATNVGLYPDEFRKFMIDEKLVLQPDFSGRLRTLEEFARRLMAREVDSEMIIWMMRAVHYRADFYEAVSPALAAEEAIASLTHELLQVLGAMLGEKRARKMVIVILRELMRGVPPPQMGDRVTSATQEIPRMVALLKTAHLIPHEGTGLDHEDAMALGGAVRWENLSERLSRLNEVALALIEQGVRSHLFSTILNVLASEDHIDSRAGRVIAHAQEVQPVADALGTVSISLGVKTLVKAIVLDDNFASARRQIERLPSPPFTAPERKALVDGSGLRPDELFEHSVLRLSSVGRRRRLHGNVFVAAHVGPYYVLMTNSHVAESAKEFNLMTAARKPARVGRAQVVLRWKEPDRVSHDYRDIAFLVIEEGQSRHELAPLSIAQGIEGGEPALWPDSRRKSIKAGHLIKAGRLALFAGELPDMGTWGSSGSPMLANVGGVYGVAAILFSVGNVGILLSPELREELLEAFGGTSPYFEVVPGVPPDAVRAVETFVRTMLPGSPGLQAERHAAARSAPAVPGLTLNFPLEQLAVPGGDLEPGVRADLGPLFDEADRLGLRLVLFGSFVRTMTVRHLLKGEQGGALDAFLDSLQYSDVDGLVFDAARAGEPLPIPKSLEDLVLQRTGKKLSRMVHPTQLAGYWNTQAGLPFSRIVLQREGDTYAFQGPRGVFDQLRAHELHLDPGPVAPSLNRFLAPLLLFHSQGPFDIHDDLARYVAQVMVRERATLDAGKRKRVWRAAYHAIQDAVPSLPTAASLDGALRTLFNEMGVAAETAEQFLADGRVTSGKRRSPVVSLAVRRELSSYERVAQAVRNLPATTVFVPARDVRRYSVARRAELHALGARADVRYVIYGDIAALSERDTAWLSGLDVILAPVGAEPAFRRYAANRLAVHMVLTSRDRSIGRVASYLYTRRGVLTAALLREALKDPAQARALLPILRLKGPGFGKGASLTAIQAYLRQQVVAWAA